MHVFDLLSRYRSPDYLEEFEEAAQIRLDELVSYFLFILRKFLFLFFLVKKWRYYFMLFKKW